MTKRCTGQKNLRITALQALRPPRNCGYCGVINMGIRNRRAATTVRTAQFPGWLQAPVSIIRPYITRDMICVWGIATAMQLTRLITYTTAATDLPKPFRADITRVRNGELWLQTDTSQHCSAHSKMGVARNAPIVACSSYARCLPDAYRIDKHAVVEHMQCWRAEGGPCDLW